MRIAIVKLSALGDIVHSMVVLQFIKKFNKDISIDWFVEKNYRELLELNPDINKVHLVNLKNAKKHKSLFALFSELQKFRKLESYDVVIDMQGLIKSAIIARLIPSESTLGFDKSSAREMLASIFYSQTFNIGYEENVIKRNFELIKFALDLPFNFSDLQNKLPFIFFSDQCKNSNLASSKKNVVLIPGASNSSKQYPSKKIVKLTQMLDVNFVIVWGNNTERILAEKIFRFSPGVHISNKLSLDALASLVSCADLVIGGDTGPTHLAWALNIPSITLFGSTPGYRNTLVTTINKFIESKSLVNPLRIDNKDHSIGDIKVKDILNLSKDLLIK
mgnify:CR=1 FL=1|tara:strand:+ start:1011 stop:2009 length:999 start_codon:yes stop_codon:yes gene_type:complete